MRGWEDEKLSVKRGGENLREELFLSFWFWVGGCRAALKFNREWTRESCQQTQITDTDTKKG